MKQRVRKAHSKSRNGCLECKKTHHKCDECYPVCGQCQRLNTPCSLSQPSQDSGPSLDEQRHLNIDDLRLLHHWHNAGKENDFAHFVDHAHVDHTERYDQTIELSFRHPYLLHSLLALSALHMLHRSNVADPSLYQLASAHSFSAMRLARAQVARGDAEHREAVFNFAAFSSLYARAEPPLRTGDTAIKTPSDTITALLDAFKMGKGVKAVYLPFIDELKASGAMKSDLWKIDDRAAVVALETDYPQMFELNAVVKEHCEEGPERRACLTAVRSLFVAIGVFARSPKNHSSLQLIQTWPIGLDPVCLGMFESHHPVGLMMLAHYAALMSMRTNYWFYNRWPKLLLESVVKLLPMKWHPHLEWPRGVVLENCQHTSWSVDPAGEMET